MKAILFGIWMISAGALHAQESAGNFIADEKSGCKAWFKHTFNEDSITWSGACKNGFADGKGTLIGYTKGKKTAQYTGTLRDGKPNGYGVFSFGGDRNLKGNFANGEPLFLNETCLSKLHKIVLSETDKDNSYVGDNALTQLYYHILVPQNKIEGALILMPGTWESTEHVLSSNQVLCESCFKNNIAVIVPSINQGLTLSKDVLALMNNMFGDAIKKYNIPANKTVIGGWSMGGLFSLRYTELAVENVQKTAINPAAVFSCDGPCDLENLYTFFKRRLAKYPDANEPSYGVAKLEQYCGGTLDQAKATYQYYSCFSHAQSDGGNAKHLVNTPTRIYNDVDPIWWMNNRNEDMYDLNALDQTAMIQLLKEKGNSKAEFINAFQKGYRIEGNRHPHSWSIVAPNECMQWILLCLKK